MMNSDLKTYVHMPRSGKPPKSMVIMLHGYGANGQDLIGLAQYWDLLLPDTVFISPDAPYPCEMSPMGFQWFSLANWTPENLAGVFDGIVSVAPVLDSYIDSMMEKYEIEPENLVLLGFSQGTMMSLYVAPRREKQIAGVLGYSGAVVGGEHLAGEIKSRPSVYLVHGDADQIVPVSFYYEAMEVLKKNGFDVSGHVTKGLQHGIDNDGIEAGARFLTKVLKR